MKDKSIKKKILTGVLAGTIAISTSTLSFAAVKDSNGTKQKPNTRTECNRPMNKKNFDTKKQAEMKVKNQEIRAQKLEEGLKTLVSSNKITQDQANKVEEAIKSNEADRKAEFEKIKSMTKEERKTYMESIKGTKVNPIKALVDNGTITETQLKDIMSILPMGNHNHKRAGCPNSNSTK